MKAIVPAFAAVLVLAAPAAALACDGHASASAAEIKKVSVAELVKLQQQRDVHVVDVNSPKTRSEQGVIPGATLLTSSANYELKELPSSKEATLVFYCANTKCRASTIAAERAVEAGYKSVAVLPEGIAGWRKAGQRIETPRI